MTGYVHGAERQKLATAIDRLRTIHGRLQTEAVQAEARRAQAIAEEEEARRNIDRLLDARRELQDELDRLALEISTRTAQAVTHPHHPDLWAERYQAGTP